MNKPDFIENMRGMASTSMRMARLCCIFLYLFTSISVLAATSVSRSANETRHADGTVTWTTQRGQHYQTGDGGWSERDMTLHRSSDTDWDVSPVASDWQLKIATDEFRFRPETRGALGLELSVDDAGLLWFDPSGPVREQSLGWSQESPGPTISGQVWTDNIYPGLQLTLIATPEGLRNHTIWQQSAIASIPAPTSVSGWGTAQREDCYVSLRYRVHDWGATDIFVDGTAVLAGGKFDGATVQFVTALNPEFWIPQTYAYKDPEELTALGDSFQSGDVYAGVWLLIDRQNSYLHVCAPYELFVDAATVLVDPDFSVGQGGAAGSEGESLFFNTYNTDYSNQNSTMLAAQLETGASTQYVAMFKFDFSSLPTNLTVDAATLTLTQADTGGSPSVAIASLGTAVGWESSGAVEALEPPSTGQQISTASHYNYNDVAWSWSTNGDLPSAFAGSFYTGFAESSTEVFDSYTYPALAGAVEDMIDGTVANGFILWCTGTAGSLHYWRPHSPNAVTDSNRPLLEITYTDGQDVLLDLSEMAVGHSASTAILVACATVEGESFSDPTFPIAAYGIESGTVTHIPLAATDHIAINGVTVAYKLSGNYSPSDDSYILAVSQSGDGHIWASEVNLSAGAGSFSQVYAENAANLAAIEANRPLIASISTYAQTSQATILNHITDATGTIIDRVNDLQAVALAAVEDVSDDVQTVLSDIASSQAAVVSEIGKASESIESDITAVAAGLIEFSASYTVDNDLLVVVKGLYNTASTLTNGEYGRDVPASAMSHLERRWFTEENFESEDWEDYEKRDYSIYSYPDSAAGTEKAAQLIPSSTAPTERTWVERGASLW